MAAALSVACSFVKPIGRKYMVIYWNKPLLFYFKEGFLFFLVLRQRSKNKKACLVFKDRLFFFWKRGVLDKINIKSTVELHAIYLYLWNT